MNTLEQKNQFIKIPFLGASKRHCEMFTIEYFLGFRNWKDFLCVFTSMWIETHQIKIVHS